MSTQIMYSKPIIETAKADLRKAIELAKLETGKLPKLVVVQANNSVASDVYIRNKRKCCEDVGMQFECKQLDTSRLSKAELISKLYDIINVGNSDRNINGIIIQKPIDLISNDDEKLLFSSINVIKDVDCFGKSSVYEIYSGNNNNLPCTVQGVLDILDYYKINIEGKHIVILGRSNIVGKPLALALLNRNATITICHSKTENLEEFTKQADILVSAIGKPKFIKEQHLSLRTKVVIDVGINRDDNDKLCGDCDFDNIITYWEHSPISEDRYITPVPKGIGPLTVLNLVKNTYNAFRHYV